MRKTWLAAVAAAGIGTAEAVSPGMPVGHTPVAQSPSGAVTTPAKPSWTERFMAPLTRNPFAPAKEAQLPAVQQSAAAPPDSPLGLSGPTPEVLVGLAQMSHRAGNVVQARQYYQKALSLNPVHLEALLGAARMEDREGQLDVATMLYQRAVAAYPRNTTALNDLALCLARRGDLQGSRQVLQQAIQIEPSKPLYRNNLAKVLIELNLSDSAMTQLSAVHPLSVANYNMGVLLSDRGRNAEATQYFSRAAALDPSLDSARAMLAHLGAPVPSAAAEATIASAMSAGQANDQESHESILPTPEAVATVPWKPPVSVDAILQPARGDSPLEPGNYSAAAQESPTGTMPALLPPVK
jgi:Flp pilus assembly protein TadD